MFGWISSFNPNFAELTISPGIERRIVEGVLMTEFLSDLSKSFFQVTKTHWLVESTPGRGGQLLKILFTAPQGAQSQTQIINTKLVKFYGRIRA